MTSSWHIVYLSGILPASIINIFENDILEIIVTLLGADEIILRTSYLHLGPGENTVPAQKNTKEN